MTRPALFYSITDPDRPGGVEAIFAAVMAHAAAKGLPTVELRSRASGKAEACPLALRDDPRRRIHVPSLLNLAGVLARHRPTVVNVHFVTAEAIYFVLLRRLFRYRLVLSFHGSDLRLPVPLSSAFMPRLLRGCDAATVVSSELRDRLLELPGAAAEKVHLVPNGVDAGFWTPPERPRNGRTLVAAGRLEPVKGFDLLISAFARIAGSRPDARLVLAGEGSERQRLTRQAEAAGIADRVEFAGFLEPAALRARYREADLFVLPSRSEGFPVALLEAMACGLPAVAADVGGVAEILTPESGRTVPAGDVAALAQALDRALDAGDAQRAAARRVAERFSSAAMLDRYFALLFPSLAGSAKMDGPHGTPAECRGAA